MPEKAADQARLVPVNLESMPGFALDNLIEAKPALEKSCAVLSKKGTQEPIKTSATDWASACTALRAAQDSASIGVVLMRMFSAYKIESTAGTPGLFTGYYTPLLEASTVRGGPYQTPLYTRPPNLVEVNLGDFRSELKGQRIAGAVIDGKLRPFADRAAIDAGALSGKGLELYWAKDPVAVFFLQIQGSGVLRLPDGTEKNIGYAAQNGHPYKAIGKELIARGALQPENTSLQTIRAWLAENPGEAQRVMQTNPSFVFFRAMDEGATGATGVVLTAGRSLAIDNKFISYHLPLWLDTRLPDGMPFQRLVVAQDTGGAITGVVRGDVFFGAGEQAEHNAGLMKQPGDYYVLLPKIVSADDKAH